MLIKVRLKSIIINSIIPLAAFLGLACNAESTMSIDKLKVCGSARVSGLTFEVDPKDFIRQLTPEEFVESVIRYDIAGRSEILNDSLKGGYIKESYKSILNQVASIETLKNAQCLLDETDPDTTIWEFKKNTRDEILYGFLLEKKAMIQSILVVEYALK